MKLTDMSDYKRLKFRDPYTLRDKDHEDYMLSESASSAWEDLETDIIQLIDNPQKEIYDRLDAGAFNFFAGQNNIYNKDGFDFLFRFSDYEELKIHTISTEIDNLEYEYGGQIIDMSVYLYSDGVYHHEIPIGQNYNVEKLWYICSSWLDDFNGYVDKYSGIIDDDRKQRVEELEKLYY